MDILLISNEDICRSRMAEALLRSFGRGMKFFTAGIRKEEGEALAVPETVVAELERHHLEATQKAPQHWSHYGRTSWDGIITLTHDAEEDIKGTDLQAGYMNHYDFPSPFDEKESNGRSVDQQISELYQQMFHALYELYRDELSELLLPRCSCGANTYCRCE